MTIEFKPFEFPKVYPETKFGRTPTRNMSIMEGDESLSPDEQRMVINYQEEVDNHDKLKGARQICYQYLAFGEIQEELDTIVEYQKFTKDMFDEYSDLRDRLKLSSGHNQFKNIENALDMGTLTGSLERNAKDSYFTVISREVDSLLTNLALLFGVLERIILELTKERLEKT